MHVIAIFGPTGVGKTAVAIELAGLLRERGENPIAISADALQVYAGLETLTAAPSAAEQAQLEHRLVGFVPIGETFSAGEFSAHAHREIDAALAADRRPIVVGGTGLYLRAALTELDLKPPPPPGLRERIEAEAAREGLAALHDRLVREAPEVAAGIEPNDRSRVIRALELLEMGKLGEEGDLSARNQLWTEDVRNPTLLVGLVMERAELRRRVDERAERIARAAVDEVRRANAAGASATARKALGFEELITGDVEALKRRTRQLAKRQLTWMRKLPNVRVIDISGRDPADIARRIQALAID